MTQEEYYSTDWHRGNTVKLENGKEYPVKKVKKHCLVLFSEEYEKFFVADYRIVDCRTSDFIDDTPKMPKTPKVEETNEATAADSSVKVVADVNPASAPKEEKAKAVPKEKKAKAAEKPKAPEPVVKVSEKVVEVKPAEEVQAASADAPVKKKRKRVIITRTVAEKVSFK